MTLAIDIDFSARQWEAAQDVGAIVERAASMAFNVAAQAEGGAEVSILLCDDARIQELNRAWRGLDKATNVLSFPAGFHGGDVRVLGDIAIAYQTAMAEAKAEDKTLNAHVSHLVVHGMLHLLGFDHEIEAEAERMEALERGVLARLGIADPYAAADAPAERRA